jgi:hypothetical protein
MEPGPALGTITWNLIVSPFFDPSQRNWFRKSQLTSMVVIDLQKPYAKTKLGECTCMMFIDSVDGC